MRLVTKVAVVDGGKCNGCATCSRVCPVVAINMEKVGQKRKAKVDSQECQACGICASRCPQEAIVLEKRPESIKKGMGKITVSDKIEEICTQAHMYPEQVICYCHRIQAKEIAAAILEGAKTPEDVARMTGARTGCGVLCITGVIRLLQAAGLKLEKAPGSQWYGKMMTVWDLPEKVLNKHGKQYYLREDQEFMNKIFPGGEKK